MAPIMSILGNSQRSNNGDQRTVGTRRNDENEPPDTEERRRLRPRAARDDDKENSGRRKKKRANEEGDGEEKQPLFRMPKSVLKCDMHVKDEDLTEELRQKKILAYEQYKKEIKRIEPKVRKIVQEGLRRKHGKDFETLFPDWNKNENTYDKKFKDELDIMRQRIVRHYFELKQPPAFYWDWRGIYDVNTIPKGQLYEGTIGGPEHLKKYIRQNYKKHPTCKCTGPCSVETECACNQQHPIFDDFMAVHVNGKLQYRDGRPLGPVGITESGAYEALNFPRSPLSDFERKHTPHSLLCDETCGCPPTCANRRVLTDGCPAVLAIVNLPGKGLGVLTCDKIERGTFITAMAGEWMTRKQADRENRQTWMYHGNDAYPQLVLSPDNFYNLYKFINHACCPNVVMSTTVSDRMLSDWGQLTMHARQTIYPGEELEVHYGDFYEMEECRCGYPVCQKRLGGDKAVEDDGESEEEEGDEEEGGDVDEGDESGVMEEGEDGVEEVEEEDEIVVVEEMEEDEIDEVQIVEDDEEEEESVEVLEESEEMEEEEESIEVITIDDIEVITIDD